MLRFVDLCSVELCCVELCGVVLCRAELSRICDKPVGGDVGVNADFYVDDFLLSMSCVKIVA